MPVKWIREALANEPAVISAAYTDTGKLAVLYKLANGGVAKRVCYGPNSSEYIVDADLVGKYFSQGVDTIICANYCRMTGDAVSYGRSIGVAVMGSGEFFRKVKSGIVM